MIAHPYDLHDAGRKANQFRKVKLLTTGNPKVEKGAAYGYYSAVLHLAPFTAGGANICPMAELAACWQGCLNTSGRGGIAAGGKTMAAADGQMLPDNAIQACRIRRTQYMHNDWKGFFLQLVAEIAAHVRKAERAGLKPCIRLNGTSDIRWEVVSLDGRTIFDHFPTVTFYDYSKIPNRWNIPANYHLSLSYSAASGKYAKMITAAAESQGRNLVAVFRKTLPATFMGRPVINGDLHDLRFLDPSGVVVGLRAKGRAKKDTSGFVIE